MCRTGPANYRELLAPLPDGVEFVSVISPTTDITHIFCTSRRALAEALQRTLRKMRPDAVVWVSWPKKASKVETDITEDTVREVALPMGLVDIKVCAVDDVWSGLKLMIRVQLRKPA